ncbi:MAG: translational GTPase TypA [Proteobacteria bacterium]|nr:translational GTPase TypA [Pseudomonadota bacterium]
MAQSLRNICIIAHVDHGKTTLVDFLLKQAGTFQAHETTADRMMDSDSQERERGITISAKNASFLIGDVKVNVVDTPGHADFGGEVERIMDMVDGAILLVDAVEGPLPQTRFVLQKAIAKGLKIVLCINKVDRPEAVGSNMVSECVDKAFDLFVELGASDEQCDFPIIYACARQGWCTDDVSKIPTFLEGGGQRNLKPLFDEILRIPAPKANPDSELQMLVSNIAYSDYLGNLALGRLKSGSARKGQELVRHGVNEKGDPTATKFKVFRLLSYEGMKQVEVDEINAGDIGLIAGCEVLEIGDTLSGLNGAALPRISVEEPTMRMIFSINTTPNSGREGKAIQSRELRERLLTEIRSNVALRLEDTEVPDQFYLLGRGELQFGILIEKMRREGLEFMVGRPNVLMKVEEGEKLEPFEKMILDLPESASGDVTKMYQQRKGVLVSYDTPTAAGSDEQRVRLIFEIPTRGILGTNSMYKTATRGSGLISSESIGYRPHAGTIFHRQTGSLIADRDGKTTEYALASVQERGQLFIGEAVDVYEGMIIGECAKDNDLNVNPVKPKKLTNMRTTGSDGITNLYGVKKMSLEKCIEWIDDDEWIEVTPKSVRLRKKILAANMRSVRKIDKV